MNDLMDSTTVTSTPVAEAPQTTAEKRLEGRVVWFNNAKGYGFLGYEGGPDVFVHFSSVQSDGYKSLKEGEEVLFNIIDGDKGPQADNVIRVRRLQPQATPEN